MTRISVRPSSVAAVLSACLLTLLAVGAGHAQQQVLPPGVTEAMQNMVGTWEMTNSDRDRSCNLTFKLDPVAAGRLLELDKACAEQFPPLAGVVAWAFSNSDNLVLYDARKTSVLELLEVEAGMFEGLRPGEGRYTLQNAALAAASKDKTADQLFGTWTLAQQAGKPICTVKLEDYAASADNFALSVEPGCNPLITRFGPTAWKMDRGQLVMLSAKGQIWRFEESDPTTWRRVPEGRQPLILSKP
jgi:Protease inhibitor Inh